MYTQKAGVKYLMNSFDSPLEEANALLQRAQTSFAEWRSGNSTQIAAAQAMGALSAQLEMSRAILMEKARQDISRLSVSNERALLSFCEFVKGVDNHKDYGINLLAHVQEAANASLDAALELAARDQEEVISLLATCRCLLGVKGALLEIATLKATVENETGNNALIEELKKRSAVVTIMQSRMDRGATASEGV